MGRGKRQRIRGVASSALAAGNGAVSKVAANLATRGAERTKPVGVSEPIALKLYDNTTDYASLRQTDPRIAARIWAALGDAETVLNVGAGTGSYEPQDRDVTAVEPSAMMRALRPAGAAPVIAASAEALPFPDGHFDAAMAVLSDHQWSDPLAGLREMRRVAKRVVVFQWDNREIPRFWLVRDYMPEFIPIVLRGPSFSEKAQALDAQVETVPIPWDCRDGFFHAFWCRPEAYLQESVRRASSPWAQVGDAVERRATADLAADLESGQWQERNAELLGLAEVELGARLLIAG